MAESLLNSKQTTINYVAVPGSSAILSFGNGAQENNMLVESVQVQCTRGVQLRHFFDGSTAAFVGRGQGVATITGLFGSAEQMKALLGVSNNDVCKMSRNITLKSGLLKKCEGEGNAAKSITESTITLKGCMVQGFTIGKQIQQDGQIYETASVTMLVTDVTI